MGKRRSDLWLVEMHLGGMEQEVGGIKQPVSGYQDSYLVSSCPPHIFMLLVSLFYPAVLADPREASEYYKQLWVFIFFPSPQGIKRTLHLHPQNC